MFKRLIRIIAICMSVFHLYTVIFGVMDPLLQRSIHLFFIVILVILISNEKYNYLKIVDNIKVLLPLTLAVLSIGYIFLNYSYLVYERFCYVTPLTGLQIILGIVFVVVVLEATRRTIGIILPIVALLMFSYAFLGPFLPGILRHRGYSIDLLLDIQYLTTGGVFGMPLGVSATYVFLFILFGSFLVKVGLGELFMNVASGLTGRTTGGPAKIAVVASGLMGAISGSPISNVLITGSFTIPMMKKLGYSPHFAGAVEAVASTGGQIMPPLMGVVAFMMAEYTGIPYIRIAAYALIPALLYYWGIGLAVHLEAVKLGLKGLKKEEVPDWKKELKIRFHLLIPILVLLYLLIRGFSPMFSCFYSLLSTILVSFFSRLTRIGFNDILDGLKEGALSSLVVGSSLATAGMISGIFSLTGLGLRMGNLIIEVSGQNLFVLLLLTMLLTLILGMGLPASASYILQVAITIPALSKVLQAEAVTLGISHLAGNQIAFLAHIFVMYFASIAVITPPVALVAYAAAGLAGSNPIQTAVTASKLGFSAYIVPFMFVLAPGLLLLDTPANIIMSSITAFLGVSLVTCGLSKYAFVRMSWISQFFCMGGGVLLIFPGLITDVGGVTLGCLGLAINLYYSKKTNQLKEAF
ncbi:MAG: TRAP transporter fused permease subunit [Bacillota bacterium]|nr:TRAP transporter fused permease subunit [Bacillota bacterium]